MAVNIVTGMTGIEHITSHDDRARNASQFGRGKYVLDIGRKFSATAVDDNLVRIQDGMCINQGTQMGIEPNDYADVEIDNGLLGTNRHDIIVMRYEKNEETLLEKASLAVVKGVNSSEPVDPYITEGNILDGGDLVDDMPLYRVVIEGVNLVSVEPLFEVFDGDIGSILEELDDKVDKVEGKGLSTNDYTNEDKAKVDNIPTKISDLENDSDFVSDENYIHTDNNYTNEDKKDVKKIDNIENISVLPTSTVYEVTSIALYGGGMVEALNNESAIGVSVGDYIYAENDISKIFNFGYEVTKTLKAGYYRVKNVYSNGHAVICAISSSTVPDSNYGIVTITELEKSLVIEKMDIDGKVDKVDGKGLSTNDYTNADKEDVAKIDTIEHSLSLTTTATGNPISISDSAHVNAEELVVTLEPIQSGSGDPSPENIRPISGYDETSVIVKDTAENPTITNTYTLQFGDTVYGAEVDFMRGIATVKYGYADLGDLDYQYTATYGGAFYASVNDAKYSGNLSLIGYDCYCSQYKSRGNTGWPDLLNGEINIGSDTAGDNHPYVNIKDENYSDATSFKTAMNGVQLVYELATPQTIQLTPQQIKMLKGNNVLIADGDMDLTYQTDSVVGDVKEWAENEFLPKSSATAQHNYSTQEQVVGTWIDGSTLYEKTYICACDNTSNVQNVISFTDERVKIVSDAYFMNSFGDQIRMLWGGIIFWDYVIANDAVSVKRETTDSNWQSDVTFVVTIQYTKTTD